MKKEEFAELLGDIHEEHILAARAEFGNRTSIRRRWGAVAACLCLVIGLAAAVLHNDISDHDRHGGLDRVEEPVYDVVICTAPADHTSAKLYIATTTDLAEYDAHMSKYYGDDFMGRGIRIFTFTEGSAAENCNVWYFACTDGHISRVYFVTKSGGRLLTAWSEADELGRALEALAAATSADTPMYLAQDDDMLFAVIGETAYYLPGVTAKKPTVSQMPAVDTEGLDIQLLLLEP